LLYIIGMKSPLVLVLIIFFCLFNVAMHAQNTASLPVSRLNTHKVDSAIAACTQLKLADPKNVTAYFKRAVSYSLLKQDDNAVLDYTSAIKLLEGTPSFKEQDALQREAASAYWGRALIHERLGNQAAAFSDFSNALALKPGLLPLRAARARLETNMRKYDEALADYNEIVSAQPDNSNVYVERANCYTNLKRPEESVKDNLKAIELNPKNDVAYNNIGYEKTRLGQYDEAITYLNYAITLIPTHGWAMRGLAIIKYYQGNYDDAIGILNTAIKYHPTVADGYGIRGIAESKLGKYPDALNDFDKAIDLNPKASYLNLRKGELLIATKDYSKAITEIGNSIAKDGSDAREYNSLGYTYFKAGDYAKAIACYDTAKVKGGQYYQPYYQYRDEAVTLAKKQALPAFIHLEWIGPIEDANSLHNDTYRPASPVITVKVKVSSTKTIATNQIKLLLNSTPVTVHPDSGGNAAGDFNTITGEYEFTWQANVTVPQGSSVINVAYLNKTVQPLTVVYSAQ
jgi:tetratricopeptide (TPR) repeat protein